MCCFTGVVSRVEQTRIFARKVDRRTQALAYAMKLQAAGDLAMVLPLPTDPAAGDGAVTFVDLSSAPYLFSSLDALFPMPEQDAAPQAARSLMFGGAPLVVHTVGAFEASFVPTAADFERLDPRFRLAPELLAALTAREPLGFAVFQLRDVPEVSPETPSFWQRMFGGGSADRSPTFAGHSAREKTYHPMGLRFQMRDPSQIFLPTVHVHDGSLPETARFDHALFVQQSAEPPPGWERSAHPIHASVLEQARGLLDAHEPVFRLRMSGPHANRDVRVPA